MTGAMTAISSRIWAIDTLARRFKPLFLLLMRSPLLLPLLLGILIVGCADTETVQKKRTVDDIWLDAFEAYEDDDWGDASAKFDIIKLQYPTSQWADDAQYYLAEISYRRGEFILAAFNYNVVRRSFPTSEWAKISTFNVAVCYEELALPSDRDQEYTRKAIEAYTDFQTIYPTDSLAMVSVEKIRELRGRLAERYMIIAEHYRDNGSRRSAKVYYDLVITEYPDSEYFEEAFVEKIRILFETAQIAECKTAISEYKRTVLNPTRAEEVAEMERTLP